jgi:putative FmdB family regulatory protein
MEVFQSITASPKKKCPECGKLKLQRLLGTGAGLIFKGSGFYETDYRSDSYKKSAESEKKASEPKKTNSKKDTKKTDTKKAAKKDSKNGKS